ncbi:hypothetical protein KC333_g4613 [Hortaea werneckii]|nr:hypothetical protein KC333_g4613 [Hortaea werneckii]KAI7316047.1 hypothetical protein KC326_g4480 [Hortaea werneckii]
MALVPCILGIKPSADQLSWEEISLSIEQICRDGATEERLLIVFLGGVTTTHGQRQDLSSTFGIPTAVWSKLCQDASGFFWCGEDGDGSYTTAFRFLIKHSLASTAQKSPPSAAYQWHKLGFVSFHTQRNASLLLCFDLGGDARAAIRQRLVDCKLLPCATRAPLIHVPLLQFVIDQFGCAVWSWRDVVRNLEKNRVRHQQNQIVRFDEMHEVARHLVHTSEVLSIALSVVQRMRSDYYSNSNNGGDNGVLVYSRELDFITSMIECLLHRSEALEKRMSNEIALAFHRNAQSDTQFASQIAESAKRDGQTTKAISVLGMLFLPGTFVSAIFSMSFFHFVSGTADQVERWTVSPKFWMYWAVTAPLTLLTIALFLLFQHRHQPKDHFIREKL